jgi:hypothetical protein
LPLKLKLFRILSKEEEREGGKRRGIRMIVSKKERRGRCVKERERERR